MLGEPFDQSTVRVGVETRQREGHWDSPKAETNPFKLNGAQRMKTRLYAIIAALIPLTAAAAVIQGSPDVQQILGAAGYTDVREIEFSDGLWEAEARGSDARWHELHIDPANGQIFSAKDSSLSLAQIAATLEKAGYREVHDLDREDGIWEADATDASGQRVELRLAGIDGRVLHSEIDHTGMDHDD